MILSLKKQLPFPNGSCFSLKSHPEMWHTAFDKKRGEAMKISGAIFDVDDTLTRSEWVWDGIPEKFLEKNGKTPEPGLVRDLLLLNTAKIGEYFKEHYFQDSKRTAKDIIYQFGKMGAPYYFFKVPLMPGAKQYLKHLHKQGVRMAILTANEKTLVTAALLRLGIYHYFDAILYGTDPENAKDSPRAFEHACEVLGTPKEEIIQGKELTVRDIAYVE